MLQTELCRGREASECVYASVRACVNDRERKRDIELERERSMLVLLSIIVENLAVKFSTAIFLEFWNGDKFS